MKLSSSLIFGALVSSSIFAAALPTSGHDSHHDGHHDNYNSTTSLKQMEHKYKRYIKETLGKRGDKHKCNSKTVTIRREW
jgi:hypothetical protein